MGRSRDPGGHRGGLWADKSSGRTGNRQERTHGGGDLKMRKSPENSNKKKHIPTSVYCEGGKENPGRSRWVWGGRSICPSAQGASRPQPDRPTDEFNPVRLTEFNFHFTSKKQNEDLGGNGIVRDFSS